VPCWITVVDEGEVAVKRRNTRDRLSEATQFESEKVLCDFGRNQNRLEALDLFCDAHLRCNVVLWFVSRVEEVVKEQ
jgi:hypothetical protein